MRPPKGGGRASVRAPARVGFNGLDGQFGHDLANNQSLIPHQAVAGARMIRKYRRQLPDDVNEAIKSFFSKAVK